MSVDKFGHYIHEKQNPNHLIRDEKTLSGHYIDADGNFNIQRKRIKNGVIPKENTDIVIKEYVDKVMNESSDSLMSTISQHQDAVYRSINFKTAELDERILRLEELTSSIYEKIKYGYRLK